MTTLIRFRRCEACGTAIRVAASWTAVRCTCGRILRWVTP